MLFLIRIKRSYNFISFFQISGVALIIVGSVVEVFWRSYLNFLPPSGYLTGPSILIAVGVLVFIVGFFGCCGALKENHCMVVTVSSFIFSFLLRWHHFVVKNIKSYFQVVIPNSIKRKLVYI